MLYNTKCLKPLKYNMISFRPASNSLFFLLTESDVKMKLIKIITRRVEV